MNQFNALRGYEPTESPIEWKIQPSTGNFKSRTSTTKTSPVVSSVMGSLNHRAIYNVDVEFHPSEFPFKSNYEYVPDPDNTPIK